MTTLAFELSHFTGSLNFYKQPFPFSVKTDEELLFCDFVITEGVNHFASKTDKDKTAWWFVDLVWGELCPMLGFEYDDYFMAIKLKSYKDGGEITATDGNENELYTKKLEICDVPEGQYEFYLQLDPGSAGHPFPDPKAPTTMIKPRATLMLPTEY